jgi:hypothetical protein
MKKIIILACFALTSYSNLAVAVSGTYSIGSANSGNAARDVFEVTCNSTATAYLMARVADYPPVLDPKISIQVIRGSYVSNLSVDPIDGDSINSTTGKGFSPKITVPMGPGKYTVVVNKSKSAVKGTERYFLDARGYTSGGTVTTCVHIQTINQ